MPINSSRPQLSSVPLLFLSAAFAAGIAASSLFPANLGVVLAACVLAAIAAFMVAGPRVAAGLIFLAFMLAGASVYQAQIASITPERIRSIYDSLEIASGSPIELTGTIAGRPEIGDGGIFIRVDAASIRSHDISRSVSGMVRLFAAADTPEMQADLGRLNLEPGSQVRISTALDRDDGFRNPGVMSRKTILDWQEIDATGTIKSPLLVEVLGPPEWTSPRPGLDIREGLIARFRELFSPQVAGVMIASLLGNKSFLDKETADIFREGGTFHILVISGFHITFIGGLAAMFIGLLTRRKWVQFVGSCGFLWLYTFAVGAEVPVVRASLMFTILWFSYVIHRTGSLANALGACGLILLAWRPADLFTPSFQLTFVSVGAIVLAGFPAIRAMRSIGEWTPGSARPFPANVPKWLSGFCETLYWNPKRWEIDGTQNVWSANLFKSPFFAIRRNTQKCLAYLFDGVLVSVIVQIAMLPLVVHYFHRVVPISMLANLWVGCFIALESFAAFAALLSSSISMALALPFTQLAEMFHWLLVSVPGIFSDIGWLSFRVPVYAGLEGGLYGAYFAFVALVGFAVFLWDPFVLSKGSAFRRALLVPAFGTIFIAAIIIFHPFSTPGPDRRLHMEFLDVGQGDSIFIKFPNGETMLVDGGGRTSYRNDDDEPFEPDRPSIGETVASEFLWEKGYSRIDHLVGTHADADHIQGLADVAANFQIGMAWFGRPQKDDPDQVRLEAVLDRHGVPVEGLTRGERFEVGGVVIEVLNPPPDVTGLWQENDRSIVLRLTYGARSFLLAGDIEQVAESEIIGPDLKADVVKVPHHGSHTSSTPAFVASTRPQFAIISVGRMSQFGHPHREIVERWQSAGAEVLTTGNNGTISFSTDGQDLVVGTFVRSSD